MGALPLILRAHAHVPPPAALTCDQFETCRNSLGLTDDELALAARHSFVHSHASKDIKDRGIAAIDAWLTPRG